MSRWEIVSNLHNLCSQILSLLHMQLGVVQVRVSGSEVLQPSVQQCLGISAVLSLVLPQVMLVSGNWCYFLFFGSDPRI
jgi:hypothetical protein